MTIAKKVYAFPLEWMGYFDHSLMESEMQGINRPMESNEAAPVSRITGAA